MPQTLSPGVQSVTLDQSQIATPPNTTTGAIVAAFSKGPLGPTLITNPTQASNVFGVYNPTIGYGAYHLGAFLANSNQCWVNRVVTSAATYGAMDLSFTGAAGIGGAPTSLASSYTQTTLPTAAVATDAVNPDHLLSFYAIGPGTESGHTAIRITSDNMNVPTLNTATFTAGGVGSIGVQYYYVITAVNAVGETIASTEVTNLVPPVSPAVGSNELSWTGVTQAQGYNIYRAAATGGIYYKTATVDASLSSYIDLGDIPTSAVPPAVTAFTDIFTVEVYDLLSNTASPKEVFNCSLGQGVSASGKQTQAQSVINGISNYVKVINYSPVTGISGYFTSQSAYTTLATGVDGNVVTNANITTGWDAFVNTRRYPVRLLIDGGYANATVHGKMLALALSRGDCHAILSMPSDSQTPAKAKAYRRVVLNADNRFGSLYSPDLLVSDSHNNMQLYIPCAGHVAAQYAYTDTVKYPWWAPAGYKRGDVSNNPVLPVKGVAYHYDKGDENLLFPNQINSIVAEPGSGIIIMGDSTLQSQFSYLSYVGVQRMVTYVETGLTKAWAYDLFDPDDDVLAAELIDMGNRFLIPIQDTQGLQRPIGWQFVSDSNNNSVQTLEQGTRIVAVSLWPVGSTRNILLEAIIKSGNTTVSVKGS